MNKDDEATKVYSRRSLVGGVLQVAAWGTVGSLVGCLKLSRDSSASSLRSSEMSESSKLALRHQMKAGTQQGPTTPEMLRYFSRCGITHICGHPIDQGNKGFYGVDDLRRLKAICDAEGITLAMIPLPFLSSSHVDTEKRPAIVLGQSPDRDKDVSDIIRTMEACADVGIPTVKYNMSLLGVMRTGTTTGRGGAGYSTYRLLDRSDQQKLTRAGVVTEDQFWERITWFLSKVVPVAERLKIKMACHPQDPGTPPGGLHGIVNVLGTPEGLTKFLSIHPSAYHGLNLCIGTTAEMLASPRSELPVVVDDLAKTGRIFNIHFRNIRGRRDDFQEVFADEGDIDMPQIAQILAKHNYDGMLMPDHVPAHPSDPASLQAFAYAMGYIKGVLQSVYIQG